MNGIIFECREPLEIGRVYPVAETEYEGITAMGLAVREATWEEFLAQVQKDDPCYLENKHLYDEGPKGRCFYLLEVD